LDSPDLFNSLKFQLVDGRHQTRKYLPNYVALRYDISNLHSVLNAIRFVADALWCNCS